MSSARNMVDEIRVDSSRVPEPKVWFSKEQLAFLEKTYPEYTGVANTPEAELRYRAGQRSVILFLRARTK